MARPKFEITAKALQQIETLAGYGLTLAQIAAVIGTSEATLKRNKLEEASVLSALEAGRAKAQGIVGKSLFERARAGDVGAIRWWEMTRANRSERQSHDHSVTQRLTPEQERAIAREVLAATGDA